MNSTRKRSADAPTLAGILERERREHEREGPPKRRSREHGELVRDTRQTVDARGDIGDPWLVPTLLRRMLADGEITEGEFDAGGKFHRLFQRAGLDDLRAADMSRVVVSGSSGYVVTPQAEQARIRVRAAIKSVGGDTSAAGLACWYLLGLEASLSEFATRPIWLGRRPLDRRAAKGALVSALGMLETFFRER